MSDANKVEEPGEHVEILCGFIFNETDPVEAWNRWRETNGVKEPKLMHLKIQNAELAGINLIRANLSNSDLSKANLEKANLMGATLHSANISGANLTSADLVAVDAHGADCWSAEFRNASLRGADFADTNFRDARFQGACLINAVFDRANFHIAQGITLDHTDIKGASFDPDAGDPWSVLRRTYTGSMVLFHVLFSFLFFAPFVAKTLLWASVSSYQKHVKNPDLLICASTQCTETKVWKVLLGFHDGWLFLSVLAVLVYNIIRLYLTFHVSRMKDAEERSGRSPLWKPDGPSSFVFYSEHSSLEERDQRWYKLKGISTWLTSWPNGYSPLYKIHKMAKMLLIIAVLVSMYNLFYWLTMSVEIPK